MSFILSINRVPECRDKWTVDEEGTLKTAIERYYGTYKWHATASGSNEKGVFV
jgi:hypothetical protein